MKKGLLFLFALLGLGASGVWAQTVTDRVSAGDPMTFSEFKALSGTGKHFAIVGSSSNTQFCYQNWFGFSANFVETLTTDHLFDLESSATGEGWYNIKRVSDNHYVSTEGGHFDASTKMDFKLMNRRADDYASEFSNIGLHVSLDNADGNHYNCNTVNLGFRSGTGGYSTYITYGPFYVVTVKCLDENDNVIQTIPCIVKEGTTTIEAPNIDGKSVLDATSKAISGDRDEEITFSYVNGVIVTYSKDTGSYTTTGNFVHEWNSTATDPQVSFAVSGGANNIASSTGYIYSGANGCTYVLTAQNGYLITGYEIVGTAQTAAQTLTPAAGGSATEFSTEGTTTLRVTGLSVQSTSFTQSTPNNGIAISSFKIFLEEVTTTATYVISHGSGVVYTSAPLPATPGETVTTLPSALQRDFCTYNVTPAEIVAGENTTVNVTVTYNMPFEISSNYDNAKWYYLKLKNATYVTYSSSGTPNVTLPNSYTMGDANAQWAFIGDAYNGFSIVNKAGGNALVLGSASPKNDGNTGANTYATLGSGQAYEKYFPKSSSQVENGFYLFTSEGYAMNQRSTSNLAYWTGGYDLGSTFSVIEVVDDYSEDVANEITPWFTDYGNYFQLKASVVEANQATYEAALVQCNLETFNELKALIDNTANYVYPATGNYRIKSSGSRIGESYIGYGQPSSASAGLITVKAENAITDASTIITLTGADGAYTISTQGKYAKNQTSNNVAFPMTDNAEEAATFHFIPYTPGVVVITNDRDTYGYFHEAGWAIPGVVRWTADAAASHWTIEDLPDVTVDVTFNLVVGNNVVNTVTQEGVAGNTTISVPSSLTANYSSLGYDFTGNEEVNVGEEDLVVNVTATLKNGVVADLANLSNGKSYTLTTERGALYIKSDHLASNHNDNADAEAGTFALLKYEDNYYLYSVDASKFVLGDGSLSETPTSEIAVLTLTAQSLNPLFLGILGNKGLNVTNTTDNYELVINSWVTADAGNQYCIIEAADFDATEALAALEEYFHPAAEAQFAQAIAQLEAYPYGAGVNQYSMIVEGYNYTSQAATIINGLKSAGYTAENLTNAQLMLDGTSINLPSAGFYRIKGNTSGKYLAAGLASNNKFAMSDATDASTIFYYDGTKLTNFGSGMCNGVTSTAWAWVTEDIASNVTFVDGETNGGYSIQTADVFFFDGGTSADRGQGRDDRAQYRSWYLEAVTTLPVTISTAKYATLYAPVALTIPDGVTAYYVSALSKTEATLTPISNTIPANTGVILYADVTEETTFGFKIADEADAINGNQLAGKVAAWNVQDGEAYTLRRSAEDESQVGLFMKEAGTLVGFKAYMPATPEAVQMGGSVKGFVFNFDNLTTGIVKMADGTLKLEGAPVYDLSGRKVAAPTKGIYVVKGKKVAIK